MGTMPRLIVWQVNHAGIVLYLTASNIDAPMVIGSNYGYTVFSPEIHHNPLKTCLGDTTTLAIQYRLLCLWYLKPSAPGGARTQTGDTVTLRPLDSRLPVGVYLTLLYPWPGCL